MALEVGSRLGVFEVTGRLGEGGMGVVYRATDTTLDRDVALKVLPDAFANDPERLARFEREAKVLASLNHPNIAQIHGLEQSGDTRALVLELVEGPTLQDRIAKGPIPLDEALPIARQIAEALEAAHEQGIIHRDLKPANVKVKDDGTVKVLDFGLAKALQPDLSDLEAANSPTMTMTAAATKMGVIMGTAAYMSPEQARGKPVDRRADIWAFGAVLYEMLTGTAPFSGDDVTQTLARVVEREPDWDLLPPSVPPSLGTYLRRCLQKDPKARVRDIGDMRLALDGAFETATEIQSVGGPAGAGGRQPLWRRALLWSSAAAVIAVAAALAGRASVPAEPRPVIRAVYRVPDGRRLAAFVLPPITIAPGGEAFAYGSTEGQVYLKAIEDIEDRPVTGDGSYADMPFFSPDGQSLGYHDGTSNQLKSVDLAAGGPSRVLADLGGRLPGGARWEPDGTVLYALPDGIWRVSENGGEPERLIAIAAGELAYGPQRLPGGEWILFTQASSEAGQSWDEADIVVAEVATGTRRVVRSGGRDARYLPTGHLVYVRGDVLYAVPFDLNRLSASGTPVAVLDGVRSYDASLGAAAFYAVSDEGTLVYQPGRAAGQSAVAWTGLDGRQEALDLPAGSYSHPRLSPDGRWLAFARQDSGGTDVWVYAVAGGTAMRRLTEGGNNRYPIWSRDGSHVVFQSDRDGDRGIFWQRADGTAPAERLTTAEEETEQIPESWSRTEDRLAFSVKTGSVFELWMWTLADRAAQRFGSAQSLGLFNARFSPDGRWVAYTQRDPVVAMWVASMGAPETRYQVGQDSDVAHHPLWSPDGHRLFYFAGLSPMAVDVTTQPTLEMGRGTPL